METEIMQTEIIEHGNEAEVLIKGRLDTLTSMVARDLFTDVAGRFDSVTLKMQDLVYCSSAGIRAIRHIYKLMRAKGGKLNTINVQNTVMQVFEITGVTALLSV